MAASEKGSKLGKRRQEGKEEDEEDDGYSTSSSYAPSAIDVSFNYVAPTEIDFMALKRLIQQLYHTHAAELNIGSLADYIIAAGDADKKAAEAIGTVVKVEDDEDGDPFAFASAIGLTSGAGEANSTLRSFYGKTLKKSTSAQAAKSIIGLLETEGSGGVVQIFHERMINMPPQIMPPLYRMLFDEVRANSALASATHFLFFSRVFSTAALDDDGDEDDDAATATTGGATNGSSKAGRKAKKMKKTSQAIRNQAITKVAGEQVGVERTQADEVGLFHPEDAIIAQHAVHTYTFPFPAVKDSDDSFNAPMYGRVAVIKNDPTLLESMLEQMTEAFTLPA